MPWPRSGLGTEHEEDQVSHSWELSLVGDLVQSEYQEPLWLPVDTGPPNSALGNSRMFRKASPKW